MVKPNDIIRQFYVYVNLTNAVEKYQDKWICNETWSRVIGACYAILSTLLAFNVWPSIVPSLAMLLNVEPRMFGLYFCITFQNHVRTRLKGGRRNFVIGKSEESLQHLLQNQKIARMHMQ
jgi:hypothetical protein